MNHRVAPTGAAGPTPENRFAHTAMAPEAPAPTPPLNSPARILVVGGGGRENALGWALARCPGVEQVWVAPGNGGTPELVGCRQLAIAESDHAGLLTACHDYQVELVVVGPESPLAAGLADRLRDGGIPVFGPGADGAQLEASKQWAKALMQEAGVPTAGYWAARSEAEALSALEAQGKPLVVKADGLAAGKGVTVAETLEEARAAIRDIFSGRFGEGAGASLVLEERTHGPEVSVFALTDGERMVLLPPAQDHKRIGEGDTGPNTGGMGAYAPAPLLDASGLEQVRQEVLEPTLAALRARGIHYRGVIYAGLMLTEGGLSVIEFNCRFGDPECETLMPLLGPELAAVLLACAKGRLDLAPNLTIAEGCSACVIAAAQGYPGTIRKGDPITSTLEPSDALQLFHAGSRREADGTCLTSGGRVLAVVAQAGDFDTAFARAYAGLAQVQFEGITYRRDIGHQVRSR
jgi:phosphoribosylamine--glycine ligase